MGEVNQRMAEFSQLARELSAAPDEQVRLKLAVEAAVELVARCHHASLTINDTRGRVLTRVGSDEVGRRASELQYELEEGPCLQVGREQVVMVCRDLTQEPRFPRWASLAHAELGVGSSMSLLVHTDRTSYGCLALYADAGQPFDADDVAVGLALAAHLAVVMTSGRQIDQLESALVNRLVIGQAEGIVMERLDVSAEQAFDYLRRVSMHTNRKVVDVAHEIATTRTLLAIDQG